MFAWSTYLRRVTWSSTRAGASPSSRHRTTAIRWATRAPSYDLDLTSSRSSQRLTLSLIRPSDPWRTQALSATSWVSSGGVGQTHDVGIGKKIAKKYKTQRHQTQEFFFPKRRQSFFSCLFSRRRFWVGVPGGFKGQERGKFRDWSSLDIVCKFEHIFLVGIC